MPKISVIMSVRNGAKTLDSCVNSILSQTLNDFEFIICDDGSVDDTWQILRSYEARDSRIVLLKNEHSQGLAFSLNRCISIARSNILARQDADDYSAFNRFEKQYAFVLDNPQYAIVGTCWYSVSDNTLYRHSVPYEPTARDQIRGGLYMHPSWMMRKDLIERVGFYTANEYTMRSQDYHLVMKVLGAGMKICNMQEYLYYYTMDETTMRRSLNWARVRGLMWIRYDSYKRNRLPFWSYLYVLKPVITNLLPKKVMFRYYEKISKNSK